jgi:hypothetical protein
VSIVDHFVMPLPLPLDVVSLTMSLVNIESTSRDEGPIADSIEEALRTQPHLGVERFGNSVVARTELVTSTRSRQMATSLHTSRWASSSVWARAT